MKTIYIGHPLMGSTDEAKALGFGNIEENIERYLLFVAWASNNGFTVISWVHHPLCHQRGLTKGDADFYLTRDKKLMEPADLFWQCGPVESSSGLVYELDVCDEFDIPIIHRPEWNDPTFMPDPFSPLPDEVLR